MLGMWRDLRQSVPPVALASRPTLSEADQPLYFCVFFFSIFYFPKREKAETSKLKKPKKTSATPASDRR
jgi:hypothetical protein